MIEQLTMAAEKRGLTVKPVAPAILLFCQRPDYSDLTPQDRAIAEKMFNGLSQLVVLRPDRETPTPEGAPPPLAWYWWWRGDRGADGATDEMERLANGDDIEAAADRVANVLRVDSLTG
ncbi:hypothetical protein ABT352_22600 [Streptosporangium sp. NPDC000563]|uniref:hypothetical protein n=1 Tax=Streptosporangium sp. NPDC000563 TaxID=3154366 RepID=UPI00332DE30E